MLFILLRAARGFQQIIAMSSSGTKYTEQQKADRSAVTAALTDPTTAKIMQDQGDYSLRKRAAAKPFRATKEGKKFVPINSIIFIPLANTVVEL